MSDIIAGAVEALSEKVSGFDKVAKFEIEGEGAIIIDENGVRAGDDDADVTLLADVDTFRGILEGTQNPTTAFMSGKLKIEGDMGAAMQLAATLA